MRSSVRLFVHRKKRHNWHLVVEEVLCSILFFIFVVLCIFLLAGR